MTSNRKKPAPKIRWTSSLKKLPALSVRQPWAWLIVNGYKPIENRTWPTKFRGEFLVHAGQRIDTAAWAYLRAAHPEIAFPVVFDVGGIVGQARLVDCVTSHSSPWFEGPYGFVLADGRPLAFVAGTGRLGFFRFVPAAR